MAQESALLIQVHNELKALIVKVESAFPKDENGDIDYHGHRIFHKQEAESAKQYKDSKATIIKNIVTWASIGLLTVIANSVPDLHILATISSLLAKLSH